MSEGKTPRRDRLDELLASWPARSTTAPEEDAAVARVMGRLRSDPSLAGPDNVSDEALWGAPLPAVTGEMTGSGPTSSRRTSGEGAMNTTSRERDRASLKELAKLADIGPASSPPAPSSGRVPAAEPQQEERKENSGMINLAALAASEPPPAPVSAPAASVADASKATAVATAPASSTKSTSTKKAGATSWVLYGGVVAAAAVAAGVFFNMRSSSEPATASVTTPPPAQVAPTVAAGPKASAMPVAPTDRGVDPSTLPAVGAPGAGTGAAALAARPSPTGASPGVVAAAPPSPAPPSPDLVAAVPTATAAPTSSTSLEALMRQAVPGAESAQSGGTGGPAGGDTPTPAAAPGSVPLKPSQGAVQGAIGAVLPGARGCLDADDPVSRVTVTFQSDGSVQNVAVSGGAAGKPAEACIRSALMKARVQPFAQPSFSFGTTIRPN
jgi:hypothetical protein